MTPHFGTDHWSQNTIQMCQNTVQSCKIAFGTLFLTTPIGVALVTTNSVLMLKLEPVTTLSVLTSLATALQRDNPLYSLPLKLFL